jgi:hypothetical protein
MRGPDGEVWWNAESTVDRGETPVFETEMTVRRMLADLEGNA